MGRCFDVKLSLVSRAYVCTNSWLKLCIMWCVCCVGGWVSWSVLSVLHSAHYAFCHTLGCHAVCCFAYGRRSLLYSTLYCLRTVTSRAVLISSAHHAFCV
jgi:hypothetical protein